MAPLIRLQVILPFVDVLAQIIEYSKFMKDLLDNIIKSKDK